MEFWHPPSAHIFLRADGNYNQAFIRQSLPGATAFADYSPDDRNICRNFNRVRGCTLHECHFADVCNRKVNEKAYGRLSFYSYEGLTLETSALENLLESCFQIHCFSRKKIRDNFPPESKGYQFDFSPNKEGS